MHKEDKIDSKTMQGVGTYRTLDNPKYMQAFQFCPPKDKQGNAIKRSFVPVMITHNGELKEDADQDDIPYIINNIAYMPEGAIEMINFDTTDGQTILKK